MVRHATITAAENLTVNLVSFVRHLRAQNLSERTVETYAESVTQFVRFVGAQGMPAPGSTIGSPYYCVGVTVLLQKNIFVKPVTQGHA